MGHYALFCYHAREATVVESAHGYHGPGAGVYVGYFVFGYGEFYFQPVARYNLHDGRPGDTVCPTSMDFSATIPV